jgi:hypothetical protein
LANFGLPSSGRQATISWCGSLRDRSAAVDITDEVLRSVKIAGVAGEVARLQARFAIKDGSAADD